MPYIFIASYTNWVYTPTRLCFLCIVSILFDERHILPEALLFLVFLRDGGFDGNGQGLRFSVANAIYVLSASCLEAEQEAPNYYMWDSVSCYIWFEYWYIILCCLRCRVVKVSYAKVAGSTPATDRCGDHAHTSLFDDKINKSHRP